MLAIKNVIFLGFLCFLGLICIAYLTYIGQKKKSISPSEFPAAVRTYTVTDFFQHPSQSEFKLSPNGKYISYLGMWEGRKNIFVKATHSNAEGHRVTSEKDRDISDYFWKGDDRLLFSKDFGGDENDHLVSIRSDGQDLKDLTPFPQVRVEVIDTLPHLTDYVLVGHNQRDSEVFDVYRINIHTGDTDLLAENPGELELWLTDHEGKLRAAIEVNGLENHLLFRQKESSPFKKILTHDFRDTFRPLFFSFDNKKLYALSNRGRDTLAAVLFDPETGEEEVLYHNTEVDVSMIRYSRKRQVLIEALYATDRLHYYFFDSANKALYENLKAQLPDQDVDIVSANLDEDKFIVRTSSDRSQGAYYYYDATKKSLTKLIELSSHLSLKDMAPMKPITYRTRDGLRIHGYLTLPLHASTNVPVIVDVHGGPWMRYDWGFDPQTQFFAHRGYAVFQPNFRGSTGYGKQFWKASFKQWGRAMQDDITDGVNWLIDQGIADPKRVVILGASYGGYAALAGAAFTPNLYAAAIDYVGISNLLGFLENIPPYWKNFRAQQSEMIGDVIKDKDLLQAYSPLFHIDKIKIPIFVAHGASDPRVHKSESDHIVESLRKRGMEVEYMVKDNEGHTFLNQENIIEFYERVDAFLKKHVPPHTLQAGL